LDGALNFISKDTLHVNKTSLSDLVSMQTGPGLKCKAFIFAEALVLILTIIIILYEFYYIVVSLFLNLNFKFFVIEIVIF